MKRLSLIIAAGLMSLGAGMANAQEAASMAELLNLIQQGQARDSQEARQREAEFTQQRNQQQSLLNRARAERTRQENESARLEQLFQDNQTKIIAARAALDERLGALKELFGVLQTVSGDTQGRFTSSLTNLQYPDRENFLVALGSKMASATELAQIEDIERLWFELQREITESGKVVRFNKLVTKANGEQEEMEVVRVGLFNLISDIGYLEHDPNE
ncbi:MAG: energy transducer TonB, partial [Gammaproteobacteria bacterium]|nr:energy transducer TonB [Gammaproteobacteria bacterium]